MTGEQLAQRLSTACRCGSIGPRTIEVINDREQVLAQGRFATDRIGYPTMPKLGRRHKSPRWTTLTRHRPSVWQLQRRSAVTTTRDRQVLLGQVV